MRYECLLEFQQLLPLELEREGATPQTLLLFCVEIKALMIKNCLHPYLYTDF